MQKKHSFSPNHKVVTSSKHNHHPFGAPTTASQGQPPAQMGASGDGTQAPQEGSGMDGMNFCNGGAKYAEGGIIDNVAEGVSRAADKVLNSDAQKYDDAHSKPSMPLSAGDKSQPAMGSGGQKAEDTMNDRIKAMGG